MVAVGVYGVEALQSVRFAVARLLVAVALGILLLSPALLPASRRSASGARACSTRCGSRLLGMVAVRARCCATRSAASGFKRRVLVLGAGRARGADRGAGRRARRRLRGGRLRRHERRRRRAVAALGQPRRHRQPARSSARARRERGRAGARGAAQRAAAQRPAADQDDRRPRPRFLELPRARDRPGRSRQPQSLLADLLRRLLRRAAAVERRPSGCSTSPSASLLLLLTAPLIALTALAVKLESSGPGLLPPAPRRPLRPAVRRHQDRARCAIDAEVGGKAVWAQKDDPRVTRVGRIIRKLRIDELPQAWSVLKGEMSFVGPRPERPQFVADLEARLPYYAERHVVKPGITGWAQINYPYGASIEDAREKLEFDLYYAKNYTPFLDLLILLQTARVVLWPEGRAMTGFIALWSHLLAAALYGALAVFQLRRWNGDPRNRPLITAFAAVSVWTIFLALLGPYTLLAQLAESGAQPRLPRLHVRADGRAPSDGARPARGEGRVRRGRRR